MSSPLESAKDTGSGHATISIPFYRLLTLQFLHLDLCLPCSQMHPPPHSLPADLILPCSQMPDPPHTLHVDLILPYS